MMSSGGAQNLRPASAPGEDAPTAGSADRNEVNIIHLSLFNSLDLLCVKHYCFYFVMSLHCFLSLMGVA